MNSQIEARERVSFVTDAQAPLSRMIFLSPLNNDKSETGKMFKIRGPDKIEKKKSKLKGVL